MSRADFVEFRKSLGRTPPLDRMSVRANGLEFAVWTSPHIHGATPLLLVNGGLLFDHSLLWPALSPLAAARQVILYDQRGRGASQAPADPLTATIDDDASDIGALRRALGIRQWDILGHSWGGGIAMLGASRDLGGTRRVITVNAVGPTSAWMAALHVESVSRLDDARRHVLETHYARLGEPDVAVHAAYSQAQYLAWFADPDFATGFAPPEGASITGVSVAARLRREGYDWRDRLRALSAPVLVLHGERDALSSSVADELDALLPRARSALISGAGHMPFFEAPRPFFALAGEFLAQATVPARTRP